MPILYANLAISLMVLLVITQCNHSFSLSSGSDMDTPTHIDPREALDKLLRMLTHFHTILSKHGLDPEVIAQVFKQIFYFICCGSLNNLLLRKDMCHWSRGMQIRYNVAQLEQWARDQKVHDEQTKVIDAMAPIVQASQLLQVRLVKIKKYGPSHYLLAH